MNRREALFDNEIAPRLKKGHEEGNLTHTKRTLHSPKRGELVNVVPILYQIPR